MPQDIEGRKVEAHTGFRRWHEAGFTSELLPIIPPGATLKAGSTVREHHLGKTPGVKNGDGTWSGLGGKWSIELQPTIKDLKSWQSWGASVGLQSRLYLGLDIDVEDAALVAAVEGLALEHLGMAPVRFRDGSPRCLLVYKRKGAEPVKKRRLAWKDAAGNVQAVELLGAGQQFVVEGPHPKGGVYQWRHGETPCAWGKDELSNADAADFDPFFAAVSELVEKSGGASIQATQGTAGGTRKSLDDPTLHAPSPELVVDALKVWRPEHMAHDEYVAAVAAIKAALGPRRDEFAGDVLEWSPGVRSEEADEFEKRWNSVTDAALGWDWVASQARAFGFNGDAQADFNDGGVAGADIPETPLERMAARYVWVSAQERYADLESGAFLSGRAFNAANVAVAPFGRSGVQSAEAEFQNYPGARKVAAATYRPGRPALFVDETARGAKVQVVNLWRPGARVAAENVADADVAPWLEHVRLIFGEPGDQSREHYLDFCAHLLQFPGRKINHAPVILGAQGVGKDTAFYPVTEFIGNANTKNIGTTELESSFNEFLLNELVVVEEMHSFTKREIYNRMKGYIAAPPAFLEINLKNQRPFTIPNVQNWLFFTNYEDALAIDEDDRRFWVHRALLEVPQAPAYYAKLYGWFDAGGIEKVAGWLKARDLSKFNPSAAPPMTEAKREMVDLAAPPATRWLVECLREGGEFHGRELVATRELVNHARDGMSGAPGKIAVEVRERHATAALKSAGYRTTTRKVKLEGLAPVRLWTTKAPALFDEMEHRFLVKRYTDDMAAASAKTKSAGF